MDILKLSVIFVLFVAGASGSIITKDLLDRGHDAVGTFPFLTTFRAFYNPLNIREKRI